MGIGRTKKAAKQAVIIKRQLVAAELRTQGKSIAEIAEALGVKERQAKYDIHNGLELFQESTAEFHHKRVILRLVELAEIDRHAKELYQLNRKKFEESERPKETFTVTKDAAGAIESTTIKEEESSGDPKFLTEARKSLDTRIKVNAELRRLFGDNVEIESGDNLTQVNVSFNLKSDASQNELLAFARELGVEDLVIEGQAAAVPADSNGHAGTQTPHGSNGHAGHAGSNGNGKPLDSGKASGPPEQSPNGDDLWRDI